MHFTKPHLAFCFCLAMLGIDSCSEDEPTPPPTISSFTPSTGDVGTLVTISGENFSTTPADNIVTFTNNATAVVTSSTPTTLTVWVPNGAANGKISVTVGNASAVSNQDFEVVNDWTERQAHPTAGRSDAVSFKIGDKAYVGTGYDGDDKNDFWEYNPATDAWTRKADFPGTARNLAVGFAVGNKGYIGTGWDGNYTKDFYEYDPLNDTWRQVADFGGEYRIRAVAFTIGDKAYVGTGLGFDDVNNDLWEFDPNGGPEGVWTRKADFPGPKRQDAIAVAIGTKGYIATGSSDKFLAKYKDLWEYDALTDTWTSKGELPDGERGDPIGFAMGGKVYIGSGYGSSYRKDFWEYDPADNIWIQVQDFPVGGRQAMVSFVFNDKAYVGSGVDVSAVRHNTFFEFKRF
jgi:N-acetylneuraminic acid mutarotase